jgi:SAM-dependent methyltransferase
MLGIDLSSEMIGHAQWLNPMVPFQRGNMLALDCADGAWAGITAFYSLIHIARPEIPRALRELKRALRPGGLILAAFHLGDEVVHLDEWWGHQVSVDFVMFRTEEMTSYLSVAGFEIEETSERDPYPDIEHQSRRGYILAKKPRRD